MLKRLQNKLLMINLISLILILFIAFSAIFLTFRKAVFSSANQSLEKALAEYSPVRTAFVPQIPSPEDFEVTVKLFTEEPADENILYKTKKMPDGTVIMAECDITEEKMLLNRLMSTLSAAGGVLSVLIFLISYAVSKRAIEPVRETMEFQKQFISDASHELKTPLSAIAANLDIITPQPEQKQWLDNIRYETDRMIRLTHSMLNLSEKNRKNSYSAVSLSDICTRAALSTEASAFEKGITTKTYIDNNVIVCGNPEQLEQLAAILLDNAIKHNKKGGFISITLKKKKFTATLSVENSGNPIPKEEQKKIFMRFYRGDKSRSSEGFGLGLSIAHGIVTAHGGKISVKSENTTVFSVNLGLKNL